jgi:hypothetical protein
MSVGALFGPIVRVGQALRHRIQIPPPHGRKCCRSVAVGERTGQAGRSPKVSARHSEKESSFLTVRLIGPKLLRRSLLALPAGGTTFSTESEWDWKSAEAILLHAGLPTAKCAAGLAIDLDQDYRAVLAKQRGEWRSRARRRRWLRPKALPPRAPASVPPGDTISPAAFLPPHPTSAFPAP